MKIYKLLAGSILVFSIMNTGHAQTEADVAHLQQRWAEVNYQLESRVQLSAFEQLIDEVNALTEAKADSAELWIWSGIIKSTYAGAKGGLGALSMAKESKKDLEQAMEIDTDALSGSAYASLGTLYFNVPGWPVGFGNDKKAEELLLQALTLNPEGIDSNYFYGTYLVNEKRYDDARIYLLKAQAANPRPNRPVADAGRQREIIEALAEIQDK